MIDFLDHSKIHFCEFWMILHERYYSPVVSTIKICSMKHIRPTKLKKMAKNLYFGSLDHSKMHFFDFWMIQHDQKLLTPFSTIIICNMKSIRPTKLEKLTKDWRDHSKFIRVARKRSQKENQIFPGHAVFAACSPKLSSFIFHLQIPMIND